MYNDEPEEYKVVGAFRDRERIGFRKGLATEIEGGGKLAQILQRQQKLDSELRYIDEIENYCIFLKDYYYFTEIDIENIIELFQKISRPLLKNSYAFVLGYIYNRDNSIDNIRILLEKHEKTKTTTKQNKRGEHKEISNVTDIDVIRYKRLIETYINS